MKLKLFFLLLMVVGEGALYGQNKQTPSKDIGNKVFFRLGEKDLDLSYRNNGASLAVLIRDINAILADSNYVVSKLKITGIASPDGKSEAVNITLAQNRAISIKSYLAPRVNIPSARIEIENKGENWEGLHTMVAASAMPDKEAVLNILNNVRNRDKRKSQLMLLHGGIPYQYMLRNFFPGLRSGFSLSSVYSSIKDISLSNWSLLQEELSSCTLSESDKKAMVYIFSHSSDSQECLNQMKSLLGGETFEKVKSSFLSRLLFSTDSMSVDNWLLLEKMVTASSDIPYKKEVLRLFTEVPVNQGREEQLKALQGGASYKYMKDHFFSRLLQKPILQNAADKPSDGTPDAEAGWKQLRYLVNTSNMDVKQKVIDVIDSQADPLKRMEELIRIDNGITYRYLCDMYLSALLYNSKSNSLYNGRTVTEQETTSKMAEKDLGLTIITEKPSRWALKTNMLYLCALMPNVEIEYLLSKRWSVNIEGQYAWWSRSEEHKYYQIVTVSPEMRYWLDRKAPFSGHYLGFYYGCGLYDLENGSVGYRGECYLSTGLSYGYMKSLGRHLSLELGLGIGYLSTGYKKYLPIDGRYVYQSTERLNYVGPTKAKIALVWKWSKKEKKTIEKR